MRTLRKLAVIAICGAFMISSASCTLNQAEQIKQYNAESLALNFTGYPEDKKHYTAALEPEDEQILKEYEVASENGILALYINKDDSHIAVLDKRKGKVWYSNPGHADEDTIAVQDMKEQMKSTLMLTYYENSAEKAMNNYTYSIKGKNFEIENIPGGIRIVYNMGDNTFTMEDIPQKISDSRFKKIFLENPVMEQNDLTRVKRYYKFNEGTGAWEFVDKKTTTVSLMGKILAKAGYTSEDLKTDNIENGIKAPVSKKIFFTIPVELTLDSESLLVKIPLQQLRYNPSAPPLTVKAFEYFGCAHAQSEGYIFVPDGSGALIHFSGIEKKNLFYSTEIYGMDKTLSPKTKPSVRQKALMPVFGISYDGNALLAIIEDGDVLASVNAYKAGMYHSYNAVYSSYSLVASDNVVMGQGLQSTKVRAFQRKVYGGGIRIRYAFLDKADDGFTAMAKYYRNYVVAKDGLKVLKETRDIPFNLELTGAIGKVKSLLGFNYKGGGSLTRFDEAKVILEKLQEQNIKNINLKYTGWFNGGIDHKVISQVKVESCLGGEKGLLELARYAEENGVELFPSINVLTVPDSGFGYNPYSHSAKRVDESLAYLYRYDMITHQMNGKVNIISPLYIGDFIDRFSGRFGRTGIPNLALGDLGGEIYSDYARSRSINRQSALKMLTAELEKLDSAYDKLMTRGINTHSMKNIQVAVEVPLEYSELEITDESVPFFQVAFHGYITYSGFPLNYSSDLKKEMLKMLQTGSVPYFSWIYSEGSKTKNTDYSYLFSNHYMTWLEEAVEIYDRVNAVMAGLHDKTIEEYRVLQKNVYETVYEKGVSVIVNYNPTEVKVGGIVVKPMDFAVKGGK